MRNILEDEIKKEQYLSAAVGAYSAAIGDGATESEASKVASDVAKEHWQDGEKTEEGSNRLTILENSLKKKEAELEKRFEDHFGTVKATNGQPMNDKHGGPAYFRKLDKQNDAIRNQKESIQKTKDAIEREKGKITDVNHAKSSFPKSINSLINKNEIKQWRKYPNTFFVEGVDKARIVYDPKKNKVSHKYANTLPTGPMRSKFAKVFNDLSKELNKK